MRGSAPPGPTLISNPLFQEYEDVRSRKRVKEACPLAAREIRDLLNAFYSLSRWVPIYYLWRPNLKDDGDTFFIDEVFAGVPDHSDQR